MSDLTPAAKIRVVCCELRRSIEDGRVSQALRKVGAIERLLMELEATRDVASAIDDYVDSMERVSRIRREYPPNRR